MSIVRTAVLAFIATVIVGCSTSDDAGPGRCTRDNALLDQKKACRADDDCPCGAHCDLGQCIAECRSNSACPSGSRCDAFGRCRSSADDSIVPSLSPSVEGELAVAPLHVPALEAGKDRTIRIEAGKRPLGAVRVAAEDGLEVECNSGSGFGPECRFDTVPAGEIRTARVRRKDGDLALGVKLVQVFAGSAAQTIAVGGRELFTRDATSVLASYTGTARAIRSGVEGHPLSDEPRDITLPLTAEIIGGPTSAVLSLHDPSATLHPEGTWNGGLSLEPNRTGTVRFPTYKLAAGQVTQGAPWEVLVEAPDAPVRSPSATTIAIDLTLRYKGVLPGRAPVQSWRIVLERSGELAPDVKLPVVGADALPGLDPNRGQTPTPWETLLPATFSPLPPFLSANAEYESIRRAYLGTEAWVDACGRSDLGQVVPQFVSWELGDPSVQTRSHGFMSTQAGSMPVVQETMGARTQSELEASPNWLASIIAKATSPQLSNITFSSFTTGTPSDLSNVFTDGQIPCAFTAERNFADTVVVDMAGTGASETLTLPPPASSDRCAEVAQRYGCAVEDFPSTFFSPSIVQIATATGTLTHSTLGSRGFTMRPVRYGQRIAKTCKLPPTARACDAALACVVPPNGPGAQPRSTMAAPLFGGTLRPLSGDLACASGGRSAATDLDENGELPAGDPARLDASNAVAACLEELDRLATGARPQGLAQNGEGLRTLFEKSLCFDGGRFITMLGLATSGVLAGDGERRGPLFHRRVQQFLAIHTFLAREAVETERLAPVVRKNPIPGRPPPAPIDERLRSSLAAWALLMHPRFAEAYDVLPGSVLYSPDYRGAFVSGSLESPAGQADGLPVAMLELLRAQVEIADAIAQRGLYKDGTKALPFAQEILPWVGIVRAFAASGYARALEHATAAKLPPPPWSVRYERADAALADVLRRLYDAMDAIRSGRNPLGIEEKDTPLYFLADTAGSGKRFSAISDYLLGDASPGSTAWATALTRQATNALEAARASFVARQDRELQVKLTAQQQADRDESVASEYGSKLLELCGPIPGVTPETVLDSGITLSPNVCYVRSELPECRIDIDKYNRLIRTDDVAYQICLVHEMKVEAAAGAPIESAGVGFTLPTLDDLARTSCDPGSAWVPEGCPETNGEACFRCARSGGAVAVAVPPGSFGGLKLSGVSEAQKERARARCAARWPNAASKLPSPSAAVAADLRGGTCYKGSLGEMSLTVAAAAEEALAAAQEVQDKSDAYAIAVESCNILDTANSAIIRENDSFKQSQSALRKGKLAADIIANTAGAVKDCASAVGADNKFGAASGVACGAAAVEAAAQSVSDGLQFAMDEAQQAHDTLVTKLQLRADVDRCYKDAKLQLIGAKTAAYRAKSASLELEQTKVQLANLKDQVTTLVNEGRDALDSVRASTVRPPAFDFWLDERLGEYTRKMRLAKRATYLAARAVEYELQQSLDLRGAILAAETPYELDAALDTLRSVAASRRINGSAASDLKIVLSLREQLLQIQSRENAPAGQQNLTDVERFRLYLQQQRFATFDDAGKYLGQRVPFSIAPLGTFEAGQPGAIAVFAKQDCAERLWSVNASIQGNALYRGGQPSFVRVDLLKSNTFYSQWCTEQGKKDPFQISSVRPSRNLFLDAQLGTDVGQQFGVANESTLFSRARIQATFNVARADFEQDQYANGETSELAARGLYGDYALFFPAELLSLPDPKAPGARTSGLDLNQLDDILLRLDYVSVAR